MYFFQVSRAVWEEMVNACWCGLLAALSLLLDARYSVFHFSWFFKDDIPSCILNGLLIRVKLTVVWERCPWHLSRQVCGLVMARLSEDLLRVNDTEASRSLASAFNVFQYRTINYIFKGLHLNYFNYLYSFLLWLFQHFEVILPMSWLLLID